MNIMRKTILLCAICTISMFASAQLLEIVSTEQLSTPTNEEMKVAGFSPKGDYLLLTNDVNSGLKRYDLATGNITTITDAEGAGWAVKISSDGQEIVYRERYMNDDMTLRNNIVKYTIKAQKRAMIAKGQRDLSKLYLPTKPTTWLSMVTYILYSHSMENLLSSRPTEQMMLTIGQAFHPMEQRFCITFLVRVAILAI